MERQTLKTTEVIRITGQSLEAVRLLVKQGVLPNVSGTRRILIPRVAIDKYLGAQK